MNCMHTHEPPRRLRVSPFSVCYPNGSNSIKNLTFTTTAKKLLGWKLCYHKLVKLSSHHLKVAIGVLGSFFYIFLLESVQIYSGPFPSVYECLPSEIASEWEVGQ